MRRCGRSGTSNPETGEEPPEAAKKQMELF